MLADPPVEEEHYIYYQPTMGPLYLLGALKNAFPQTEVDVRYLQGFGTMEDHVRAVEEYRPDIYGLTFKTPMARLGYRTLRTVKERFPDLCVIAGGSHVSVLPEEVMEKTPVDACFRSECEDSILRIVQSFAGNRVGCEEIPGAVYRSEGSLIQNPVAPFRKDLDSLPWPAWDLVDFDRFPGMPYNKRRPLYGGSHQQRLPLCVHILLRAGLEDFRSADVSCALAEEHHG